MGKAVWPPVLPASYPQPPQMVDEYAGLKRGDHFKIRGENGKFRFTGADPARDHLYAIELDRRGFPGGVRTFAGNRFRKKVK